MRFPLIFYIGGACDAVPAVVGLRPRHPPLRGARAWLVAWSLWNTAADVADYVLASRHVPNLFLDHVSVPLSVAIALWALAFWQSAELWRLTFRITIVPLLAAWALLTLAVENTSSFSTAAEPMVKLVTLAAAAFTLVARSAAARGDHLRHDWFWVSAGLALYYGAGATLGPASALLAHGDLRLYLRVYHTWTLVGIGGNLLLAKGLACPADP